MINVLYISYDGMTDPLGQSQVLPYIEGLSKVGYSYDLISFEKSEAYIKHRNIIEERCKLNDITWHPLPYTKKPPLLSTLKDLMKMQKKAFELNKKKKFQIVHCRSYISAKVGLKMQKKCNTKFVFDMRGFWADERVEGGIWNIKKPLFKLIYNYFKRQERSYFNRADHVISLTEKGKQELLKWNNLTIKEQNITVIPCCVDTDLFNKNAINPHQKRALKKALGIKQGDFILGYVGSIGTWYMLEEMLDFFSVYHQNNPQAKFMFLTGENPETIYRVAKERGVAKEKIIMASTSHQYVPLHVSLFDFSIFFIRPTFSKKASSPTKQGEIMAMGIPLICNAGVGDTDEVVRKFNAGIVLNELNTHTYQSIRLNPSQFNSDEIRKGAVSFFSLENGVEKYREVYRSVC